jgi:glycosyltransferase involved in cell wall biosynthesis
MNLLAIEKKQKTKKVLIVAHNHPNFSPGGAEIVAYDLFNTIRDREAARVRDRTYYEPFFLAAVANEERKIHTGTPFQTLVDSNDEILFWGGSFDYFYQSQNIANFMYVDFKTLLQELQPDVIHFHHIIRLGLEAIQIARQVLPEVKIVFTIHEFILMCLHDGQMVRKHNNELCEKATPDRCHQCFPEITPQKFKSRETFIKAHLDLVDCFISPSQFLADRFITWGLPTSKMQVLENGRKIMEAAPPRTLAEGEKRNTFGYFGQINPYKGVILLMQAAEYLSKNGFTDFRIELFGNVTPAFPEFQKKFAKMLDKCRDFVTLHGKYKNEEMCELIKTVDWAIVPSTWWENSPLVIQEIFMHQRPIICSNIGGMVEKVSHEQTGLTFKVNNYFSLAETIKRACIEENLWSKLVQNIEPRLSIESSADRHIELYDSL